MEGGHVVLDSTGMLYDRILAFYTDKCQKKKEERLVHGRYTTGLRPRADTDKGTGDLSPVCGLLTNRPA